eukprot:scaffold516_cov175-Amphora_coffeaeformis.AAC.45
MASIPGSKYEDMVEDSATGDQLLDGASRRRLCCCWGEAANRSVNGRNPFTQAADSSSMDTPRNHWGVIMIPVVVKSEKIQERLVCLGRQICKLVGSTVGGQSLLSVSLAKDTFRIFSAKTGALLLPRGIRCLLA